MNDDRLGIGKGIHQKAFYWNSKPNITFNLSLTVLNGNNNISNKSSLIRGDKFDRNRGFNDTGWEIRTRNSKNKGKSIGIYRHGGIIQKISYTNRKRKIYWLINCRELYPIPLTILKIPICNNKVQVSLMVHNRKMKGLNHFISMLWFMKNTVLKLRILFISGCIMISLGLSLWGIGYEYG